MALFNRKKNEDALVQRIVEEVSKAGNSMSNTPYGNSGYSNATAAQPSNMERSGGQGLLQTPGFQANPLPRPATDFGSQLGPAAPFLPAPLDPVFDDSGRALPRIWEYPVAWNLDLNQRSTPWSVLRSMSDQIDIIHRSIEIKVAEIVKLNWSFTIEDSTINQIMADENCSHAKAAGIARDKYSKDITSLREFWENPYPQLGRTFSEWMTEFLWQHFVFDGTPVYPRYNLGKEVIGFEIVDAPTIKVLLDNRGAIPAPPSPAFQQVLWGFPRGEYQSTEESDGEFFNGPGKNDEYLRDQLAYFVRNRRTWSPYGFSAVEEAVPSATLYLERQRWMKSEYQDGAAPLAFFETDSDEMDHLRLAAFERIFNDRMSGQTSERHRMKVLPKGFKPIFAPTVDERYKDTYDHFLIMRIATIFGVAPSALGVVPRSGLGGSGERAGEAQSALSISQKPLEGFLIETINTLSRRFLGTDKNITFSFDDTDDNVQQMESKAKAYQTSLSSAQMTLNDVRGELGLPLYDMPEADEPFIVGAGGAPTFLKGQLEISQSGETVGQNLEGAASDQATPSEDAQSAQGAEDGQTENKTSDGKDKEDETGVAGKSATADEMRDFAQFVKSRNKRGNWRAFDFVTVSETIAEKLNEEAYFMVKGARPIPDRLATWAIEYVEGQIKDTPKETFGLVTKVSYSELPGASHKDQIEKHYAPLVQEAYASAFTGLDEAVAQAVKTEKKAGTGIVSIVNKTVKMNLTKMSEKIAQMYLDSGYVGTAYAVKEMGAKASLSYEMAQAAVEFNWNDWTPGSPKAAAMLDGGRFAATMDRLGISLKDVKQTAYDRIGNTIADGVAQGLTAREISSNLADVIDNPDKAMTITVTETNRAFNEAAVDQYSSAGLTQFEWYSYDGACPECLEETGAHDIGYDVPPAHPNCRCVVLGVVPEDQVSTEE